MLVVLLILLVVVLLDLVQLVLVLTVLVLLVMLLTVLLPAAGSRRGDPSRGRGVRRHVAVLHYRGRRRGLHQGTHTNTHGSPSPTAGVCVNPSSHLCCSP